MVEGLIGTALQVGVVLVICRVAWLIFGRRKASFRKWLGLTAAPPLLLLLCLVLGAAGAWLLLQTPGVAMLASGPGTVIAASTPNGVRAGAIVVLAVGAVFKTAFAEELFFRGLIGKRLYGAMGSGRATPFRPCCSGPCTCPCCCCPTRRARLSC